MDGVGLCADPGVAAVACGWWVLCCLDSGMLASPFLFSYLPVVDEHVWPLSGRHTGVARPRALLAGLGPVGMFPFIHLPGLLISATTLIIAPIRT